MSICIIGKKTLEPNFTNRWSINDWLRKARVGKQQYDYQQKKTTSIKHRTANFGIISHKEEQARYKLWIMSWEERHSVGTKNRKWGSFNTCRFRFFQLLTHHSYFKVRDCSICTIIFIFYWLINLNPFLFSLNSKFSFLKKMSFRRKKTSFYL